MFGGRYGIVSQGGKVKKFPVFAAYSQKTCVRQQIALANKVHGQCTSTYQEKACEKYYRHAHHVDAHIDHVRMV